MAKTIKDLLLDIHHQKLDDQVLVSDGKNIFKLSESCSVSSGSFNGTLIHIKPLTKAELEDAFGRCRFDDGKKGDKEFKEHIKFFIKDM